MCIKNQLAYWKGADKIKEGNIKRDLKLHTKNLSLLKMHTEPNFSITTKLSVSSEINFKLHQKHLK